MTGGIGVAEWTRILHCDKLRPATRGAFLAFLTFLIVTKKNTTLVSKSNLDVSYKSSELKLSQARQQVEMSTNKEVP